MYFSPNIATKKKELCTILEFQSTPNLRKYLGFPIKLPGATSQDFNFVIERVQSRLSGWKGHLLSFAGRVVLTKLVLAAIPSYIMQGVFLPGRVLNSLDQVCRNFIWGSSEDKRKLHLVARPRNLALVAKLGWRLKTEKDKSWARVLTHKYWNPNRLCSRTWSAIKKGREICDRRKMDNWN